MRKIFLEVVNINVLGGYLILAVLFARLFLRKAPKRISCFLWLLVGIRFFVPFSIESSFSLIPSARVVSNSVSYEELPVVTTGFNAADQTINRYLVRNYDMAGRSEKLQPVTVFCAYVWLTGVILMLGYFCYSWYHLKRKVATAIPKEICGEKVYCSESIDVPFLFGIAKPHIYLPMNMDEEVLPYVIAHEKAHRKRHDYLVKPIACFLLILYWFNPLLWVSFVLLCRDIEYACDEQVIRELGKEHKKAYSSALLSCSAEKKKPNLCPVAFGEVAIRERVLKVLSYKKPAVWLSVAAAGVCVLIVLCFMTHKRPPSTDGSVIEYDGCQIVLEEAVVCEETEGIILSYRIVSDVRSEKELREFAGNLCPGISGTQGWNMNENGDYEVSVSGFYSGDSRNLQSALTFQTREGVEIGSFDPALAAEEESRTFEAVSESDASVKATIKVSSYFMKIEFEDNMPNKDKAVMLLMDTEQGERWKVARIPMQLTAQSDSVSYDQELWIRSGEQNEEQGRISLVFEEPVRPDEIQSFTLAPLR